MKIDGQDINVNTSMVIIIQVKRIYDGKKCREINQIQKEKFCARILPL